MGSVKFFVALEPFETVLRIYWRTFMWYHLCIKDREVLTMEFQKLVTERFSVLEYERRDVAPELVQTILEAGLAAPTACNFQPQRIKVIQSDADRAALSRVVSSRYDVPLAFLVCYDRRACWIRPMDGKSSGDIDAAIVTTHMMLQATELGLGSIWVMYWDPVKMKQEFSLSEDLEPVALLIVGHKSPEAAPRKGHCISKSLEEVLI